MIKLWPLLISIGLFSCSPELRFNRLIKKHPYLLEIDSVSFIDTIRVEVPKVVYDTVINEHFFHEITRDTLILQKERLTVKIFHDTIQKNVFIYGECDTVTVEKIIERTIPVKYYEKTPFWKKTINWLVLIALLYGAYRLLKFIIVERIKKKS